MSLNPLDWLRLASAAERLMGLEARHVALIDAQAKEIQALKDRVTKLESREEILIAEAKGAASSAASAAVTQNLTRLALRLGALEERTRLTGTQRPPGIEGADG